jgi:hypothetical protein
LKNIPKNKKNLINLDQHPNNQKNQITRNPNKNIDKNKSNHLWLLPIIKINSLMFDINRNQKLTKKKII